MTLTQTSCGIVVRHGFFCHTATMASAWPVRPMPADRLVTVELQAPGDRDNQGVWVPGAITNVRTWASRHDKDASEIIFSGGTRTDVLRAWVIRWDARIAATPATRLMLTEDSGLKDDVGTPTKWDVQNIVEVVGKAGSSGRSMLRRRFLRLEGQYHS